ncbi:helix-turn-helix domain-containing protein [Cellulosimicrobium terreum]|nr:helix-turn-helix domain-containing protein [Cellulosimicrobium terreum]
MPAPRYTPDEDALIRERLAAGVPQRQVAKELGRTAGSVASRAHKLGIRSDRTETIAATQAVIVDAKARRSALEVKLLEDAEHLRQQVRLPHEYIDHGGKDYIEVRWTQDEPSPTDKLKLMQAVGVAIDRSLKLALHDADGGHVEAVGMLDGIAAAIREAADRMPEQDAT